MKRILVVLLGLVLLSGVVGLAGTAVTPRVYDNFLLFDNASGAAATKLAIIFDTEVTFDADDIVVFGGDMPTMIAITQTYAFIDVAVVKGGTFQLELPADSTAVVTSAFWFD